MTIAELGFWSMGVPQWHRVSPWLCLLLVRSDGQPSNLKTSPAARDIGPCFLLHWRQSADTDWSTGCPRVTTLLTHASKTVWNSFCRRLNLCRALSSLCTYTSAPTLHDEKLGSYSKSVSRTHSQQTQKSGGFSRVSSFPALFSHTAISSPIDSLTLDTCCLCVRRIEEGFFFVSLHT